MKKHLKQLTDGTCIISGAKNGAQSIYVLITENNNQTDYLRKCSPPKCLKFIIHQEHKTSKHLIT